MFVCRANVVVSFQDKQYVLEDIGKDVKYPMRSKSVERVKSQLGESIPPPLEVGLVSVVCA